MGTEISAYKNSTAQAQLVDPTKGMPTRGTGLVTATLTRPTDTTTYASGDAMTDSITAPTSAGYLTFANAVRMNGAGGVITSMTVINSSAQTTKLSAELWLFNSVGAPMTLDNDNAVFTPTDTELANLVAVIPFSTAFVGDVSAGAAGNCVYNVTSGMRFKAGATTTSIYGTLVVRNSYVPIASETFTFVLMIDQD